MREYADTIPIIVTTLARLKQHGPYGPIWWRYGHQPGETLAAALTNHNTHDDYLERHEALRKQREAEEAERRRQHEEERQRRADEKAARQAAAAEAEARRQQCQRCGQPRHDDLWGQDPTLQYHPPPDGAHCAACRRELAGPRTRLGRKIRRILDDT